VFWKSIAAVLEMNCELKQKLLVASTSTVFSEIATISEPCSMRISGVPNSLESHVIIYRVEELRIAVLYPLAFLVGILTIFRCFEFS
jgi:hypothetical protein